MNLIIDIGNTVAKVAVFEGNVLQEVFRLSNRSLDGLSEICKKYPADKGIVASVVTLNEEMYAQLQETALKWLYLNELTPVPIMNLYKSPRTLGNDRLAAVVGAFDRFPGRNLLVIDAGTALTYDFIDASGRYHGGNISPGLRMRFKALNLFTDRLPLVSEEGAIPDLGYDTQTAIRAGVMKGMELEINGYINSLKKIYPELLVFLTGGDEFSFDTKLKSIIFADRFLVLKGLNRILNYNDEI